MKRKIYTIPHIFLPSLFFSILFFTGISANSQTEKTLKTVKRTMPIWWIGESVGGNFNFYSGTTQVLNQTVTVPTAFHNGEGLRLYFSFLGEYRPNKVWGAMLNVAFNNSSSSFDGVITPVNSKAFLYTVLRYVNIEPSIRVAPFSSAFYVFASPTLSINSTKEFFYEQDGQHETRGDWSGLHKYIFGGQVGTGIDIPVSKKTSANQVTISPFVSYLPKLFNGPRNTETWAINTFRGGVALKFGTHKTAKGQRPNNMSDTLSGVRADTATVRLKEIRFIKEVQFSVQAPKIVTTERGVKEIFPLRNSIFFNAGSTDIPDRYVQLNPSQALAFKETQLVQNRPVNWYNSRAERQLAIYHNILNILGDRLRNSPQSTISLLSAGKYDKANDGKALKESIKKYLVTVFGIDASRISTGAGENNFIASVEPHSTKDLAMRREDDRRVDITSSSPGLLESIGSNMAGLPGTMPMQTVPVDSLAGSVIFNADGAEGLLTSWLVNVTDEQGSAQQYGPYTQDKASVPGKVILGNNAQGNYSVVMTGQTKTGQTIRKETVVSLYKMDDAPLQGLRYSVLFNFDKSKTVMDNERFLTDIVAPLITDSSTVMIYGHTDIIGGKEYNLILSDGRVRNVRDIIEQVLSGSGKKGVKFEYYGFGNNAVMAPFDNKLPEERFYNRTVIIDIIQGR